MADGGVCVSKPVFSKPGNPPGGTCEALGAWLWWLKLATNWFPNGSCFLSRFEKSVLIVLITLNSHLQVLHPSGWLSSHPQMGLTPCLSASLGCDLHSHFPYRKEEVSSVHKVYSGEQSRQGLCPHGVYSPVEWTHLAVYLWAYLFDDTCSGDKFL